MKNRIFHQSFWILFIIVVHSSITDAQAIYKLNVDQAVVLGMKNSIELKNLQLDYKIQEQKNNELTTAVYPTVAAAGGFTYYTNVPKVQFPSSDRPIYEVLKKEGVKDGSGNEIDVANSTFAVNAVSFVQPLNTQLGLSVNQLLFQPDVFVGLQARKTILQLSQNNIDVANENVKEKIHKAYYAVLITQKQIDVLASTKQRLSALLRDMNQMFITGFAEKLDVDKLQVTLNNTEAAENQLNNILRIGKASLKMALGIQQSDSLELTQNLDIQALKADLMTVEDFNYEKRKEIALLNTAMELQKIDFKRYKLAYLPTLAAFYQFQRSGQKTGTPDLNGEKPWFWFNTGLVGLQLNVPIYSGGKRKFLMNQSRFAAEKVENSLQQMKQFIDLEQEVAKSSLNNAIINLDVQESNVKLAEEVFTKTKLKYENGLGSSFEVLQSDTELQRAQGSYFQALYEAMIAKTSYAKAYSKL
ncbi:MAG: TolC family protein [Saprospiraceae bacterium]|nr:TolC family protein [Saprospiraceae bacterium]